MLFFKSLDDISDPLELINVLTASTEMFWSFAIVAFYCEFGEMVTSEFECYYAEMCRCDWHSLPIKIQKMHLVFMLNTQQPTIIQGYPRIWCTREIFKAVINSILNLDTQLNFRKLKLVCHYYFVVIGNSNFYGFQITKELCILD